ncbi:glycosyltransferase [Loigolactobacillus backii]|uniref:glycosyltransferase n=1 Tax=Loigolactobacillus backii TaxID=375175 RepID=UPI0009EF673E|nr:glycosyltransferase [Loigolactobacillus backii]MDA5387324.1 glycosyltransferase [Loigolactobacillus backii]MDA5389863.1 glycosyltransferase [Loigolactobacillus backii]PIO88195.1 hypothetical protein B8A32_03770 [Loigolactobacillus backii]
MIRVLVVGDFMRGSGLTRYLVDTFSHLDPAKYQIDVLKYGGKTDMDAQLRALGWHIYAVTPITSNPLRYWLQWRRFLKQQGHVYQIIHFNYSAAWNYLPIKWASQLTKAKIVVHSHNSYFGNVSSKKAVMQVLLALHQHGKKVIARHADLMFATSTAAAKWLFPPELLKKGQVMVLRNGVDLENFAYAPAVREKLRQQEQLTEHLVVGFTGVLLDRKNPLFAVDVFQQIHQQRPDAVLVMAGAGGLKPELEKRVAAAGLTQSVRFLGVVSNMAEWYQAFDLFLFPSKAEGFGLVAVEAQAAGLPTFVSEAIPAEVVATPICHQLPLAAGAEKWAQQILTNLPEARQSEVATLTAKHFSISESAQTLDSYYNQLLGDQLG